MSEVNRAWLHERGNVHDARIRAVRLVDGTLEIDLDDEWANERGLSKPRGAKKPLTLRFADGIASGDFVEGAWISEVQLQDNRTFLFVFTDHDAVSVTASTAEATELVGD